MEEDEFMPIEAGIWVPHEALSRRVCIASETLDHHSFCKKKKKKFTEKTLQLVKRTTDDLEKTTKLL